MENDKLKPAKSENKDNNASPIKTWHNLKWNNPQNNRFSPSKSRKSLNIRINSTKKCKKCGRFVKNNTCVLCQKIDDISKIYPQTKGLFNDVGKAMRSTAKEPTEAVDQKAGEHGGIDTHFFATNRRLQNEYWWRCNGPCQYKMPFFGMVRRAVNRAPGPCDGWWARHSGTCGGTFIKVRSPDSNYQDCRKNGDIRKFFLVQKSGEESTGVENDSDSALAPTKSRCNTGESETCSQSTSISTASTSSIDATDSNFDRNNIKSLAKNLKECSLCKKKVEFHSFDDHEDECLMEICDKLEEKSKDENDNPETEKVVSCIGCDKTIPEEEIHIHLEECFNHGWNTDVYIDKAENSEFNCPLCMKSMTENKMKEHIDACLNNSSDDVISYVINSDKIEETSKDGNDNPETEKVVSCIGCDKTIPENEIYIHLEECFNHGWNTEVYIDKAENSEFNCPLCMKSMTENKMKEHIDVCLNNSSDDVISSIISSDL